MCRHWSHKAQTLITARQQASKHIVIVVDVVGIDEWRGLGGSFSILHLESLFGSTIKNTTSLRARNLIFVNSTEGRACALRACQKMLSLRMLELVTSGAARSSFCVYYTVCVCVCGYVWVGIVVVQHTIYTTSDNIFRISMGLQATALHACLFAIHCCLCRCFLTITIISSGVSMADEMVVVNDMKQTRDRSTSTWTDW